MKYKIFWFIWSILIKLFNNFFWSFLLIIWSFFILIEGLKNLFGIHNK